MKLIKQFQATRAALCTLTLLFTLLSGFIHAAETQYTCPMHPHYISDSFGTCPICGMDLVELEGGAVIEGDEAEHGLTLPPYMIQRTGVRIKPAETAYFGRSIRSFGEVVVNQRLQTDVSLRVEGWIEELIVNAEGDEVEPESLLFRFYSPQLIAAQQDYITALSSGITDRVRVTEDRLRSLGVQKKVVEEIRNRRQIKPSLPYYAEQKGSVENISIRQGSYLRPGAIAMRIQSYEKVWVRVNLAEQDISFVNRESRVDVDFPSIGIHRENVTIDYISPAVEEATRTAQMRLILENPDGIIRPGTYVDVTIMSDIRPRLAVPYESVLQNKEGSYVILERGDGTYQAREILTGLQYKGLMEVQAGLAEGDQVVVSGQFLIDSESSLRESFRRMEKLALSLAELDVSEHQLVLLNHMVEGTLYVHEELIAGRLPNPQLLDVAEQSAQKLYHEMKGSRLAFVAEDFLATLQDRAGIMTFSGWRELLAGSVEAIEPWVLEGRPRYYNELGLAFFTTEDRRSWIQLAGDIQNPFGDDVTAREIPLDDNNLKGSEEHSHAQ
ncbi:efflux RND transporter periplasmic adaptor subunit [Desulfosediminicola sp.]|uniref:efflux RND transporter periplasmic adaptor subunit n=1 Tax=Desulfosediminicola sp. TaxID=2886825 RepID=UPI003AF31830